MKEIFYEESAKIQNEKSAKIKYYTFKIVSITFYVMMGFWFFIFFNFTPVEEFTKGNIVVNIIMILLPLVFLFFSGFLFGKIKNKFYVDYDYAFVSGSVRIAKVIKNIKRKPVIKFDISAIEKMGKYGSETYAQYEKTPGIKKSILTSNMTPADGKDFYYLVVNVDETKNLLLMECSETFMVTILKYGNNKMILEKDFK